MRIILALIAGGIRTGGVWYHCESFSRERAVPFLKHIEMQQNDTASRTLLKNDGNSSTSFQQVSSLSIFNRLRYLEKLWLRAPCDSVTRLSAAFLN